MIRQVKLLLAFLLILAAFGGVHLYLQDQQKRAATRALRLLLKNTDRYDGGEIRRLLLRGADVNTPDSRGLTAVFLAATMGDTNTLSLAIKLGGNVASRDSYKNTPLHQAASNGHTEAVRILLDANAPVNPHGPFGLTPMDFAFSFGRKSAFAYLKKRGGRMTQEGKKLTPNPGGSPNFRPK